MKRKFLITSIFLLFSSILFNSCDLLTNSFNREVKDYFYKYTDTASIFSFQFDGEYPVDKFGYTNLPSDSNKKITFYLINPQKYIFTKPENIKYVINYNNDYVTSQIAIINNTLNTSAYTFIQDPQNDGDYALIEYTISEELLAATEGGKDVSPEIIFINPNTENQRFDPYNDLKIVSNSTPLSVRNLTVLTDPSNNTYVLGFFMPDMSGIHKDIKKIIINNIEDIEYPVTLSANPTSFDTGIDFTSNAFTNNPAFYNTLVSSSNGVSLDTSNPNRIVFYKTGVELNENANPFSVILEDERGLSSIATVTDRSEKLNTPITNPEDLSTVTIDESGYATVEIIARNTAMSGNTVDGDITVYYTITRAGNLYKQGQGTNTANVQIATGAYVLETWTHKPGFIDSDSIYRSISSSGYVYVKPSYTGDLSDGGQYTPYRSIEEAITATTQDGITEVLIMLLEDVTLEAPITVNGYNLSINGKGLYSVGTQLPLTSESQAFEVNASSKLTLTDIKSGKVKVNAGSEVTLTGSTTVNTIELTPNTKFYTSQLTAGTTQIAKIVMTQPSGLVQNAVIIESKETTGLSEADIARFELNNPGYFLKRSVDGKGTIGISGISVVPIYADGTPYTLNVSGISSTNTVSNGSTITLEYIKDAQNNTVTAQNVSMKLTLLGATVQTSDTSSIVIGNNVQNGIYLLEISFKVDDTLYHGSKLITVIGGN